MFVLIDIIVIVYIVFSYIGKRFGILQSKLAIARLLHNYKFYISQNTILPVEFTSESFVVSPDHSVNLRVEPIQK